MRSTVCTIATRRELPEARVLAWSLRMHDPGAQLLVLLLDDRRCEVDPADEPLVIVRPSSLGVGRYELLAGIHAARELAVVLEPAFLRYAVHRIGGPIAYLSVDSLVYAPLDRLLGPAGEHDLVLVPRLQAPVPRDHVRLTDEEVIELGVFDQGCLALAPTLAVDAFLRSWSDRLEHDRAKEDLPPAAGRFLDLAPGFLPAALILTDPGIGASHLNLHERRLTMRQGRLMANQSPLMVVHFDGLDGAPAPPENPHGGPEDGGPMMRKDSAGVRQAAREALQQTLVEGDPVLSKLINDRRRMLSECGARPEAEPEYGYERLPDGTPLSRRLRRGVRDAELHGGLVHSPFTAIGMDDLLAWLNGPGEYGKANGVSRYWLEIYHKRRDLQVAYPDLDGADGRGFMRWAARAGRRGYATPERLLPWGD